MPNSFSKLVENIQDSIQNLFSLDRSGRLGSYPTTPGIRKVLATIDESMWMGANGGDPLYRFTAYDIGANGQQQIRVQGFDEFALPLNPTEINQDEPFSIVIRATQGGTAVNHSGNRYKDLTIAGTTGVHPFKGSGGATADGTAVLQPNDLKHKSGYFVFLQLRNWFRAYYEHKNLNKEAASNHRLVFQNFKDGEFLIVELMRFSMKRSAGRPHMYDYSMNFKVIGALAFPQSSGTTLFGFDVTQVDKILNTAFDYVDAAITTFAKLSNALSQIESNADAAILDPLRKIGLFIKKSQGSTTPAKGTYIGTQILVNNMTASSVKAVLLSIQKKQQEESKSQSATGGAANFRGIAIPNNIDDAVKTDPQKLILDLGADLAKLTTDIFPESVQIALNEERENTQNLPRSFYENTLQKLKDVRDNAADKFNLSSSVYNSQYERTVTTSAEVGKTASDEDFELLGAFNSAIKGINVLLSSKVIFKSAYPQRINNLQDLFGDQLSVLAQPAVKEIPLDADITLERLALRELGDESRWPEIVELNDLKPPFIVQDASDTTPNVKRPGDYILIPSPIVNGFSNTPSSKELSISSQLKEAEKSLGIDLRLTPDFDLELTNKGDLSIVQGAENAAQAVILKLSYEKMDLLKHPELGVGINIGTKINSVSEIKSNIISSLTADPRFESIQDVSLRRDGGSLFLSFTAKIKNIDLPVPITLKI